jgi:predicted Zn-dependent protease with MMP-like domain
MMDREEFEKLVEEGYQQIPEKFREKIKNVGVLIEDLPSPKLRHQQGLGPHETLLGFYHGIPHTHRGDHYGVGMTMPDTITLFQIPIEQAALGDPERIKKIVADTVWHEVGHYFGLDEDAVQSREAERGIESIHDE